MRRRPAKTHKNQVLNAWWCDEHREVHLGDVDEDFSLKHASRMHALVITREVGR